MTDFSLLLQQGVANAWLFIPSAVLLGALHGLEPGHSKTMMAAFIVAIRGTVKQAVMLGVAATLSHTAVVWLIALGGMYLSQQFTAESVEPWLQLISGIIILATAVWMFWRTWRDERAWEQHQHSHDHHHDHHHHDHHHHEHHHDDHHYDHDEHAHHHHDLNHAHHHADHPHGRTQVHAEYQDAHERAHANEIRLRFANREATNGQILLFGLTGGLIPCPAAITVLLLCIQVKAFTLGAALVVCFSIGLALTLVAVGVGAALSVQHASRRWPGFATLVRRAPYFSSLLIAVVGVYMLLHGWARLPL
ncbi:nickel/cobalt efflux protein RcnA [Dickeya solani]|uniref:Nickel/cobalt efflux system n=1 Tax=Dickeya solani TaxID=1089444 RepID=A0ABU4EDY4_9GAMM|nr:nickel/cobalt efflux protein RcnA [Dickeya solani]MCA7001119.1 nickel/cobalt efflux protein RcnA [Dickeya solani]MCZ0821558.1 nickel/cobalt efflux protein RcnA [Dickeya solani]MDV6996529.1 nickel/cobalt efflux protein RcnA [Dickeya solani]MDV7002304.1 nickel/cobalt efflux protein RcnA [Dickeya solani]MDV7037124.1 nickel/cobalt efflux protein RcnA [Dickeya solani]